MEYQNIYGINETLTPLDLYHKRCQPRLRTDMELWALQELPGSMVRQEMTPRRLAAHEGTAKRSSGTEYVERNPAVKFGRCAAFFPDLLLRELRIDIEIDGGIHDRRREKEEGGGRVCRDGFRDHVLAANGYATIRLRVEDTMTLMISDILLRPLV